MKSNRVKYTFRGMNQDVSEGKHPLEFYYYGKNIRLLTTDKTITGGVAFEKGNKLRFTLPDISIDTNASRVRLSSGEVTPFTYGNELQQQVESTLLMNSSSNQKIIGHTTTRDSIILFSTDDNNMDGIWKLNVETYAIELLYVRNLGFSINNPIQAVYNYENKRIEKVYWVDGKNQIRAININHSKANGNLDDLIDVNSFILSTVTKVELSQPKLETIVSGGSHTAGMIQYAYNQYRLNDSQTRLSPLSGLIPLDKGEGSGGGDVNEIVGSSPVIKIKDLDTTYTHIKVYAIKYTSYNQIPSISLIKEEELAGRTEVSVFDDGGIIAEISMEELLFLGGNPMVPKHIESKDNIMFFSNYTEQFFDVDLDTRAYSFSSIGEGNQAIVADNVEIVKEDIPDIVTGVPTGLFRTVMKHDSTPIDPATFKLRKKHNAINPDYDKYKYQSDGTTIGGEGKYLQYRIGPAPEVSLYDINVPYLPVNRNNASGIDYPEENRYFKDQEIQRIGIQFYNHYGQISFPKWIADFKAPEGNLMERYNTLSIKLKPEFFVWLNDASNFDSPDDVPVGYKIVRANRTLSDRTIITQGFLNGMMSNVRSEGGVNEDGFKEMADDGNKLPSLLRVYGDHHQQMRAMEHYRTLGENGRNPNRDEMITSTSSKGMKANTYQYNTLFQMFSPEVLFTNLTVYEGMELRVKGMNKNRKNEFWAKELQIESQDVVREAKVHNGITPHDYNLSSSDIENIVGDGKDLCDSGIFGPANRDTDGDPVDTMDQLQFYRDFTGGFIAAPKKPVFNIMGKPMITEKGQGRTIYNNNPQYTFYNTLTPLMTDDVNYDPDGGNIFGTRERREAPGLTSVNSWGAKCLTMATHAKIPLEKIYQQSGITETNGVLLGEIVLGPYHIYAGNLFGGNSYEAKKRTAYLEIGDYVKLDPGASSSSVFIKSPGDTYVQKFKFAKVCKTDTEVLSGSSSQVTEIVETIIESTVDLRNRNDISLSPWDSRFQPRESEYHNYNQVYSQQPTLLKNQDADFTFVRIKDFDTRIIASKRKIPGENIDSWTDVRINEYKDLNGKYGPVNALVSFRDEIFAFQDNAFAAVAINPRVQVPGDDGISIELGSGQVLHDYKYISSVSGCLNKWGVIATNNAIYYLDGLNKAMMRFTGQGLEGLSGSKGMHKRLAEYIKTSDIRNDNPYLGQGITFGYDVPNNDVYFTYNNDWTLCFNEKLDTFVSFYVYDSPLYIYAREKMLTLNPFNLNALYEMHAGRYNEFYGNQHMSVLEFVANPETDHECLFTNLEYKSVAKDDQDKEQRFTWEQIRLYNEFQDSGYRNLTRGNIRKLNRNYRISMPRNQNSRDRIRNNWAHIVLQASNPDHLFYLNQDIILYYIANHIAIE